MFLSLSMNKQVNKEEEMGVSHLERLGDLSEAHSSCLWPPRVVSFPSSPFDGKIPKRFQRYPSPAFSIQLSSPNPKLGHGA